MASKGHLSFAARAEQHSSGLVKRLFAIAGKEVACFNMDGMSYPVRRKTNRSRDREQEIQRGPIS